jgi:hypothetical protein
MQSKNAPDEEVDTIQVGSGLLIDWDLSTPVNSPQQAEERTVRCPLSSCMSSSLTE